MLKTYSNDFIKFDLNRMLQIHFRVQCKYGEKRYCLLTLKCFFPCISKLLWSPMIKTTGWHSIGLKTFSAYLYISWIRLASTLHALASATQMNKRVNKTDYVTCHSICKIHLMIKIRDIQVNKTDTWYSRHISIPKTKELEVYI